MNQFRGEWRDGWFVVPYHVLFADIDAYGHVNNAVYFTYFEWGRTQLWFELTEWGGALDIGFIVAHASCDFKRQLAMEPIEIRTRVGEMGTSSIEFLAEIRKGDGELVATGRVVTVLYDWERQAKRVVGDDLRARVAALQE
ncbi:MAG TPA: thioesterase family protein [Thermoanaerobaculia bacterium]|nr:thioesterase family protein [Thermoanaerobaculia bacterium]